MYLWNRYRVSDIVRFINDTYFFQTFVPPLPVDDGVEDDLIIVEPDDAVDAVVDSGAAAVKSGAAATADGQPNPYLQPTPADHGSPRAQVDTPPDIDPASLPVDPHKGKHFSPNNPANYVIIALVLLSFIGSYRLKETSYSFQ